MERGKRDTLLGIVFFAGVALLMWATARLGDLSLDERQSLVVRFPTANSLRAGDPVFVLGIQSGQVTSVRPEPNRTQNRVRVEMEMRQQVSLRRDANIQINDSTLLGGKQIDIDPGVQDELSGSYELIGTVPGGPLEAIGEADIDGATAAIRDFFLELRNPDNNIGALLNSRDLYDNLAAAMKSIRTSIEAIEKREGPINRLIYSTELGQDVTVTVKELREVVTKLNNGQGLLPRLINDQALADDVAFALKDVRALVNDLRSGEGMFARLINDPELANDLADALENVRSVTAKANDPKAGLLGALFGDGDFLGEVKVIVANVREFTTKMNEGKGLLAKLVNDQHLGERLDRILNQVSRAIEDAREAAPVGTFFQVLAGPF